MDSPLNRMIELVRRLRSGQYKQGRNNLCVIEEDGTEKLCCLGVVGKMAEEAGVIKPSSVKSVGSVKVRCFDGAYLTDPLKHVNGGPVHSGKSDNWWSSSNLAHHNDWPDVLSRLPMRNPNY